MPKLEPSFAAMTLDRVPPGLPVIYQRTLAFAAINPNAPQRIITLAVHDAQQHMFVYRYFDGAQPNVLVPRGEIIYKPALFTLTENLGIQPSTDKLYMMGDDPCIVVQLPGVPDVRVLSLKDGSLTTPRMFQMDAFESWEAGVMSMGAFVPLLKV